MSTKVNDKSILAAGLVTLSIIAIAVGLSLLYEHNQTRSSIERALLARQNTRSPQLYCIKAVAKGSIVTSDCLEIRLVSQDRLPPDGLSNPSGALGRETKVGLAAGDQVCGYMFGTSTKEMMKFKTYWPRFKELPEGDFYKGVRINRN
ncbi:MAG: SAF domain-containing protein [Candidatus Obscuribacterales bacterium]|jgi:hypothetical protein